MNKEFESALLLLAIRDDDNVEFGLTRYLLAVSASHEVGVGTTQYSNGKFIWNESESINYTHKEYFMNMKALISEKDTRPIIPAADPKMVQMILAGKDVPAMLKFIYILSAAEAITSYLAIKYDSFLKDINSNDNDAVCELIRSKLNDDDESRAAFKWLETIPDHIALFSIKTNIGIERLVSLNLDEIDYAQQLLLTITQKTLNILNK